MNYKALFSRVFLLITSPAKAWHQISKESDPNLLISGFVYPLIGICCFAVFLGTFIGNGITRESLQPALMRTCAYGVALFVSFFLCSYLVDLFGQKYLKSENNTNLSRRLVGYSMVVIFVLNTIVGLYSEFWIFELLFQFYTVKIVWDGAHILMKVKDNKMLTYTIVVSLLIIFSPYLVQMLFNLLSKLAVNG